MDKYPPVYLMLVALDLKRKDIVEINIRLSDAPESTAKTNSLPLDAFERIFLTVFKFPVDQVQRITERLRSGDGFTINLSMEMDAICKPGLLSPTQ